MIEEQRSIIIDDNGIKIIGKWRIGELLNASNALANTVNGIEITGQVNDQPAPNTEA